MKLLSWKTRSDRKTDIIDDAEFLGRVLSIKASPIGVFLFWVKFDDRVVHGPKQYDTKEEAYQAAEKYVQDIDSGEMK